MGQVSPASELPDSLKPLVRRQAIEVRQTHFGRDAEALIERVREAARPQGWTGPMARSGMSELRGKV
jgi:hypothetical protein